MLKTPMQTLRQVAAESQSAADIEASTQALAKGTEAFAAQRMNRGISRALAGRHIEALADPAGDFEPRRTLRRLHNLKSASASIGAQAFSALCKQAETAARTDAWDEVHALLPALIHEFAPLRDAVDEHLKSLGGAAHE
mgnify:CR=1 FL=1